MHFTHTVRLSSKSKSLILITKTTNISVIVVVLGAIVVSVFAIGPNLRGFKPSTALWVSRAKLISSTPSFGRDVKLSAPCRKILLHVKEPCEILKSHFVRQNSQFPSPLPPALILDDSVGLPETSGGRIRSSSLSI
jgi:hypothetical protein